MSKTLDFNCGFTENTNSRNVDLANPENPRGTGFQMSRFGHFWMSVFGSKKLSKSEGQNLGSPPDPDPQNRQNLIVKTVHMNFSINPKYSMRKSVAFLENGFSGNRVPPRSPKLGPDFEFWRVPKSDTLGVPQNVNLKPKPLFLAMVNRVLSTKSVVAI